MKKLPDGSQHEFGETVMCGGEGYGIQPAKEENFIIQVANYDNQGRTVTEEISVGSKETRMTQGAN